MEMKNIYAAFVKAQVGFAPALKTNTNPHFKSKYADLAACVEAVIDSLNANGIGLVQKTHMDDTGVTVETMFVHTSGESMTGGVLHVPAPKQDPQGYGSALSYARRYSLMAACGIAPEDDDGNAASKGKKSAIADSFRSSPTMGELEMLSADEQIYIRDLASEIVATMSNPQIVVARIEGENLDDTQKMALWSILDSKTRAAIKKAQATMREAATA